MSPNIIPSLQPLTVAIADLHEDPANARKGHAIDRIAASLKQYGQRKPIVVNRLQGNKVEAGNGTLAAAKSLGWTEIAAVFVDDDAATAAAYGIADNRVGEFSQWDAEILADLMPTLDGLVTGFTKDELKAILPVVRTEGDTEPQIDKAEELRAKWGVESGQMWQLGDHRIICGDCTDAEVVARVMDGEKFRLCFTSPPYADQRTYHIGEFDWLALANGCADRLFEHCGSPSDIAVNLGMSYKDGRANLYWDAWLAHCESLGHPLYGWYVWDKGRGFPGEWNGRLAPAHEFVFHFSIGRVSANRWVEKKENSFQRNKYAKNSIQRRRDGGFKAPTSPDATNNLTKVPDSVIRMPQETSSIVGNHPAVYPVDLPAFGLETWSQAGDLVYEPFSGSGTTLIACENLGRKCRAIEISPAYVAVAIERWAQHAGREPELL